MSRATDVLVTGYLVRHCTETRCGKCSARARWYRRKARRSVKTANRKSTGRK